MTVHLPMHATGTPRLDIRASVDDPSCGAAADTDDGTRLRCTAVRGHKGAHIADLDGEPMWWGLP